MNWKEYITEHINPIVQDTTFESNTAARNDQLGELRLQLQINELPEQLEDLYNQTNGIQEILSGQLIGELVWPIERVIQTKNIAASLILLNYICPLINCCFSPTPETETCLVSLSCREKQTDRISSAGIMKMTAEHGLQPISNNF